MANMAKHPNAKVVREMNEAMSGGDTEGAGIRVSDDVVWHEIGRAQPRRGKADLAASMAGREGQNITFEIHDIVANDDRMIGLGTAHDTHGDRSLTCRTAEINHVRDGRVTDRWAFSDDTKAITDFFG
jgi:ketosteroid isomerase-like protein